MWSQKEALGEVLEGRDDRSEGLICIYPNQSEEGWLYRRQLEFLTNFRGKAKYHAKKKIAMMNKCKMSFEANRSNILKIEKENLLRRRMEEASNIGTSKF